MANILDKDPFYRENRDSLTWCSVDLLAFHTVIEPLFGGKIDSLSYVEASWESSMVGARVGKYKFSWSLKSFENVHTLLLEIGWRHHGDYVKENVWILLEKERALLFDSSVELFSMLFWHTIP